VELIIKKQHSQIYRTASGILKITDIEQEGVLAARIKEMGGSSAHPMLPDIHRVEKMSNGYNIWREELDDIQPCCERHSPVRFRVTWYQLNQAPMKLRGNPQMKEFIDSNSILRSNILFCCFNELLDIHGWLGKHNININDLGYENWGVRKKKQLVIRDFGDCDIY